MLSKVKQVRKTLKLTYTSNKKIKFPDMFLTSIISSRSFHRLLNSQRQIILLSLFLKELIYYTTSSTNNN